MSLRIKFVPKDQNINMYFSFKDSIQLLMLGDSTPGFHLQECYVLKQSIGYASHQIYLSLREASALRHFIQMNQVVSTSAQLFIGVPTVATIHDPSNCQIGLSLDLSTMTKVDGLLLLPSWKVTLLESVMEEGLTMPLWIILLLHEGSVEIHMPRDQRNRVATKYCAKLCAARATVHRVKVCTARATVHCANLFLSRVTVCCADVHPERSTVRDYLPICSHDDSQVPVVSKGSDESMPQRRILDSSAGIYSRKIHGASLTKDRKVCSGHVWNLMCRPTESLPEGKFWECSTTFGYGRSAQDLHQCQPELTIEEDCVKIGLMHCFALTTEEDCVKNGMMQYCFALANQEDCIKNGMIRCMMNGRASRHIHWNSQCV